MKNSVRVRFLKNVYPIGKIGQEKEISEEKASALGNMVEVLEVLEPKKVDSEDDFRSKIVKKPIGDSKKKAPNWAQKIAQKLKSKKSE